MDSRTLNGDQAFAFGALNSGVKLVTSYPGSPSSGTVESLIELAKHRDFYVEWSSNEKVSMEMGIGASIAGRRALVCAKSVGLNAMIDPLMALNLTPVHGGLVILLGDDPGGYGSQNDQDSRPLASFLEIPMLEPANPSEGYLMMREAFSVSELYNTPLIIRHTRSFTLQKEPVQIHKKDYPDINYGFIKEPFRFVPVPKNAVEKHRDLHRRIKNFGKWSENTPFNRSSGSGKTGIIGAGFAYQKLMDVFGNTTPKELRLLKLGVLYPLPENIIADFLRECRKVLIVEENEPYLEIQIKAIAHDIGCSTKILGKQGSHIHREGELFRWQIQEALLNFLPELKLMNKYSKDDEEHERPEKENFCAGCGYDDIFDRLEAAAESLGQKPVFVGDPGCLVTIADRLDAKYAMGSAVAVADGLHRTGIDNKVIALFGDSSFYHSSIPAICNAVHNRSPIMMVVLDNAATAASGFQPHPGVGRDAMGQKAPSSDIEQIARACGVKHVYTTRPKYSSKDLDNKFKQALACKELSLVIVQIKSKKREK
ncbi:MAG: thiamine pyrophosphate-dependent enzyme [Candidatus Aminicenantes bacterium]|nr:thiamine pyrophosphate-dependent enzyme [Candidatus Aminicenantes bacterium]